MNATGAIAREAAIVSAQLGRTPRRPWRAAARCSHGFPTAIVSPSRLEDGSPFPTLAWLTCPWLAEKAAAEESSGGTDRLAREVADDRRLAWELERTDAGLRAARADESEGVDACASVGIAGQRDPLGVKCLHAHIALELVGIADPIGRRLIEALGRECSDSRCEKLASSAEVR